MSTVTTVVGWMASGSQSKRSSRQRFEQLWFKKCLLFLTLVILLKKVYVSSYQSLGALMRPLLNVPYGAQPWGRRRVEAEISVLKVASH